MVQGVVVQIKTDSGFDGSPQSFADHLLDIDPREFHEDRGRGVVHVFDLGFGQRGLVTWAPVNRFQVPIHHPLLDESGEQAKFMPLESRIEGAVGFDPNGRARRGV